MSGTGETADHDPATSVAGQNDETSYLPPVTEAAPELAWSSPVEESPELFERRSWRQTWGLAAAVLAGAALIAGVFGAGWLLHRGPSTGPQPAGSASRSAASTTASAGDGGFVAIAFSLSNPQHATYGTAGTEDQSRSIAMDECKAHFSDEVCTIAASTRNGCVAFAVDADGGFSGGEGPDADSARKAANGKQPGATYISPGQCSK
jgi:hypothetical protein